MTQQFHSKVYTQEKLKPTECPCGHLQTNVHSRIIHKSQKVNLYVHQLMNRQTKWYIYTMKYYLSIKGMK